MAGHWRLYRYTGAASLTLIQAYNTQDHKTALGLALLYLLDQPATENFNLAFWDGERAQLGNNYTGKQQKAEQ